MATWMTHTLIADQLLDDVKLTFQKQNLDAQAFVLGSVGADAGDVTPIQGVFDPPAYITHWTHVNAGGNKSNCRYMDFYDAYIKNETDITKWSFYIGYWIHLYTDVLWHRLIYFPLREKYEDNFGKNKMRQSSLACELEYLQKGNTFSLWDIMKNMEEFTIPVLPYYHDKSLTNHIQLIHEVYSDKEVKNFEKINGQILVLEELLSFVETAVGEIREYIVKLV